MKRVVILGGGESGVGAAILAKKQGFDVFVSDLSALKPRYREELMAQGIAFEETKHTEDLILNADEIVKSPGIPDKAPIIKALLERGTPIISEIEFGARYTNARMIGITGSNGKTTTTMLIYHILKSAGYNVGLAGNIGTSLALQVATGNYDYFVVELSSFQLEGMYDFRANEAILLNITPDHLDRYDYCMQNYVDAKMRIVRNQQPEDSFVYWTGDPILRKEVSKKPIQSTLRPFALEPDFGCNAYLRDQQIVFNLPEKGIDFQVAVETLSIKGPHNCLNAMAAGIVALRCGVRKEQLETAFTTFQAVEHRLERVRTVNEITFINDSKATNVNSCFYALQSMATPVVLILGGTDKGNDYSEIEQLVAEKARALVFMGADNSKLRAFFGDKPLQTAEAHSMQEAIDAALSLAQKGDAVLLSPCCASFDLFKNYEDRGHQFKQIVNSL